MSLTEEQCKNNGRFIIRNNSDEKMVEKLSLKI